MVSGVLAFGMVAYVGIGRGGRTRGTPVAARPAPPLALQSDRGGAFSLLAYRGDVVLVYFGYTHCPDICPATLTALGPVMDKLGPLRDKVRIVFVTLDPQRDKPAALRAYLDDFGLDAIGLSGTPAAVAVAAHEWGVAWRAADGGAFIDRSSVVSMVGPHGMIRLRYGFSQMSDADGIASDIRRLLATR
jgi:protein SCO1/2